MSKVRQPRQSTVTIRVSGQAYTATAPTREEALQVLLAQAAKREGC
jgi:hypothetical protein